MFVLENNLNKYILENNISLSIRSYNKIQKEFLLLHEEDEDLIRKFKNYLIGLNCILAKVLQGKNICKRSLFEERISNSNDLENCETIDELNNLFKEIIYNYCLMEEKKAHFSHHPIIKQAINYIHSNLNEDLSLNTVSDTIHVSKNYLSYLFSKFVGSSFSDYVNKVRIDKAKILLKENKESILDIAIECGFSSQSYFCSVFKKYENITPKQFQKIEED